MDVVNRRFEEFGFPLRDDTNVIPEDNTTLFVCSGMQKFKHRFGDPDGKTDGTLQSCIRTNDLDLVGDGSHLTSFKMLGNFSFAGPSYQHSVQMWQSILSDLNWKVEIHIHPSRDDHKRLWDGYTIIDDEDCVWSDGAIGGNCCEVYYQGLEIGNLVNPLEHSTDVGFGFERMLQIMENKNRVDETSLFDQGFTPIARDHIRTLILMQSNNISPGNKGRSYVCRRLIRRIIGCYVPQLKEWFECEDELLKRRLASGRRLWRKNQNKPPEWWWDTCGILPEEIHLISNN
jgi:alanyl-tRNA synthetase